jgi:diguanylate cyclase (GGDEF)-like protein/PAS domain S-box-containing protein
MELLSQFCAYAFATALLWLLMVQLRSMPAVRWWYFSWAAGTGAALLHAAIVGSNLATPGMPLWVLLVVCCYAQACFALQGFLVERSERSRKAYSIATYTTLTLVGAATLVLHPMDVATHLTTVQDVTVGVVCGLVWVALWSERAKKPGTVYALCGLLSTGIAIAVVSSAAALHVVPIKLLASWEFALVRLIGPTGAALTVAYLTIESVGGMNERLRSTSERLMTLVDSAQTGICEIDTAGRLQFANRVATEMFGVEDAQVRDIWLGEYLEGRDEVSRKAIAEFALRPTTTVSHAQTRILGAGGAVATQWSSTPVVRNGRATGAVITLQDASDREQAEYFLKFRSEILEKIAQNKPVDEVLRLLSTAVESRLPGLCCSVLMCEKDSFQVTASSHWPEELPRAVATLVADRFFDSDERSGTIERRPWDTSLREMARSSGYTGTWTEPLISSANDLLGTIVFNSKTTETLTPLQTQILDEAARLGALTIEHRRWFERLLHQGHHDVLTGLPNRLLLTDRLKQALARAQRKRTQMAYLCIDLDRFKHVNDTLGHDAGDLFLQQISVRFAARIRSSDTLARTGGDEFTAILSDIKGTHDAQRVADSLVASLREPFEVDGHTLFGGASIGIAVYPQDGADIESLQRNADRAMYRAKAQGRNGVQCYSEVELAEDADRNEIETHLHRAIELGNFALHFQPQFSCDRRLSGFEALLRFNHPKLGLVPPSRFIPMAEESGLILPIGEWVLNEACRQIAEWQKKGIRPVRIAVNVSPLQFAQVNFAESVQRALKTSNVSPELLELELTEGVVMSNIRDSSRQMAALAEIGVRLAVDDFGTGYSSLSYLHQMPINLLKIDRSFVAHMLDPDGTRCIVEAIISLAHRLGLETLAEGVETEQQLLELNKAGCNLIQGFYFSRPLAVDDASSLLWQETMNFGTPTGSRSPGPGMQRQLVPSRKIRKG